MSKAIARGASGAQWSEGRITNLEPGRICQKPVKSSRAKEMRTRQVRNFLTRWGQEGSCRCMNMAVVGQRHKSCPEAEPAPRDQRQRQSGRPFPAV